MKQAYLFGALAFIVFVAIGVFYLVPGPTKPVVFDDPTGIHVKHSLVFFGLGIVSLLAARFAANAQTTPKV